MSDFDDDEFGDSPAETAYAAHTSDGKARPNDKGDDKADSYAVTADELRQFIERAEQLAAEKKDIAEQEKELFAEAKGRGYCSKSMKKIIAERKRKPDDIAEEEAILEIYRAALGMG